MCLPLPLSWCHRRCTGASPRGHRQTRLRSYGYASIPWRLRREEELLLLPPRRSRSVRRLPGSVSTPHRAVVSAGSDSVSAHVVLAAHFLCCPSPYLLLLLLFGCRRSLRLCFNLLSFL